MSKCVEHYKEFWPAETAAEIVCECLKKAFTIYISIEDRHFMVMEGADEVTGYLPIITYGKG